MNATPPPPPGSPSISGREPTDWERRDQLGFFPALFRTAKKSLLEPEAFWSKFEPDGPPKDALFYGWTIAVIQSAVQALFFALQFGLQGALMRQILEQIDRGGQPLPPEAEQILDLVFGPWGLLTLTGFVLVFGIVLYPVRVVISSAVIHVCCLLFGVSKNGYRATFRVINYASGPMALQGIPMVGIAAYVYTLVLEIWGLARAHESTVGRAVAARLLIPVLVICCGCSVWLFAVAAAVSQIH